MLKTSSIKLAEPKKGIVGVGGDSRAKRDGSKIVDESGMDDVKIDGGKVRDKKVRKYRKTSKNLSNSKKQ